MDTYIPDILLDDCERMAKLRMERVKRGEHASVTVPVHVNVLLGLIRVYRDARNRDLQKSPQE